MDNIRRRFGGKAIAYGETADEALTVPDEKKNDPATRKWRVIFLYISLFRASSSLVSARFSMRDT